MKKHIAKKWVAALRSGAYKQGRGQLRDKYDRFCCLGVLCNLHAQEHPKFAEKEKKYFLYGGSSSFLPTTVMKWSGVKDDSGQLDSISGSLVDLNDLDNLSFDKIADIIEKHWKEL